MFHSHDQRSKSSSDHTTCKYSVNRCLQWALTVTFSCFLHFSSSDQSQNLFPPRDLELVMSWFVKAEIVEYYLQLVRQPLRPKMMICDWHFISPVSEWSTELKVLCPPPPHPNHSTKSVRYCLIHKFSPGTIVSWRFMSLEICLSVARFFLLKSLLFVADICCSFFREGY